MRINTESFAIVLIGDWNKLYTRPDWIAENVYKENEMEVGVEGVGADFSIAFKKNDVVIRPTQEKMVFSTLNLKDETLEKMCKALNNFVNEATSAISIRYGFNCQFTDEDRTNYYGMLDSISDTENLVAEGIRIIKTEISRVLEVDQRVVQLEFGENDGNVVVSLNEHHEAWEGDINTEMIRQFVQRCENVLQIMGYEMEEDV